MVDVGLSNHGSFVPLQRIHTDMYQWFTIQQWFIYNSCTYILVVSKRLWLKLPDVIAAHLGGNISASACMIVSDNRYIFKLNNYHLCCHYFLSPLTSFIVVPVLVLISIAVFLARAVCKKCYSSLHSSELVPLPLGSQIKWNSKNNDTRLCDTVLNFFI